MRAAEATREASKWKVEWKKQRKNRAAGAGGGKAADVPFHNMNLIQSRTSFDFVYQRIGTRMVPLASSVCIVQLAIRCTLLAESLVRFGAKPRRDAPTCTVVDEGSPVFAHSLVAVLPV